MADKPEKRKMELNIEGKLIDLCVTVGPDFKGIRYELTSESEIEPLDAAFSLWLLVKSLCRDQGISPEKLIANYEIPGDDEIKH